MLAQKYGLSLVMLFGSQATGYTHKKSDVDIGYLSPKEIGYRENYKIALEVGRIFRKPDVEMVNIRNVSPELKKQVADQGIVLYEGRRSAFDLFRIHANRTYIETKPLRAYRDQRLKEFLQTYAG